MKIKQILFFLLLFITFWSCKNESNQTKSENIKSASSFFPKEKTKILIVGTFHFDYPNLDANKIKDKDKIDVLKEPKKSELTELIEYIKQFKPTKIAIEAFDDWDATKKLKEYKKGKHHNKRDERYQIGFRIATELKLDKIYSVDAKAFDKDLIKMDSVYFENYFKGYDFKSTDPFDKMTENWLDYENTIISSVSLLDYFKHMNSKESHQYDFGSYLIGDFKLDEYRGADILSIWWYNRNLRIFRNIQRMTNNTSDRILVIFGNGHAAILRQLIESSPEYEFIEFNSLENK